MNLDFSFLDTSVLSSYILKGFVFSIQLTLIAMIGGIVLGTILSVMSYAAFIMLLKLQFPVWPTFISG